MASSYRAHLPTGQRGGTAHVFFNISGIAVWVKLIGVLCLHGWATRAWIMFEVRHTTRKPKARLSGGIKL